MSDKRHPEEYQIEAVKQVVDRGHSIPLHASPPVLISPRTASTPG